MNLLCLPIDEFDDHRPNLDLSADYLELKAVFSDERRSFSRDIVDVLDDSKDPAGTTLGAEQREMIREGTVNRIGVRSRVLGSAYPFSLDERGRVISYIADGQDHGHAAYLVSLVLSNLRSVSPLLEANAHPSEPEIGTLRSYFQYFATAALAAEIGGPAWSFGFPRPDGTGFQSKLKEIWGILKDGNVMPHPSSPVNAKDDGIDIFAWRRQRDGLPGFLLAAAQVATGRNWKDKSIRFHVVEVFPKRWFSPEPATRMVPYHVIPFTRPDDGFRDDVVMLGNVMHRLRVPFRVQEACELVRNGVSVEAFDQLTEVWEWLQSYIERVGEHID